MDFLCNEEISLAFIQETWLRESNNDVTATIKANGYNICHNFRKDDAIGGGVAIIYKHNLKLSKVTVKHGSSFESVSAKIFTPCGKNIICTSVYRTGPNLSNFLTEFDDFIGNIFTRFDKIIICGDFNIHMDEVSAYQDKFSAQDFKLT